MNSTSPLPLRERLKRAQKHLGLNATQLADELDITPEWLSKIVNGRVAGSGDIGLRLDAFLRNRGLEPRSILELEPASIEGDAVAEDRGHYSVPADQLRQSIRAEAEKAILSAGNDIGRLGWLLEELRSLRPAHWEGQHEVTPDHERAIRATKAEERGEKERTG